jgi:hypothetical protein
MGLKNPYLVGVEPSLLLLRPLIGLLYHPWMVDGDDCGAVGKGNRSTRRKPAPVALCQVPQMF